MPLLINSLGDGHTDMHIHTCIVDKGNLGTKCTPVAGKINEDVNTLYLAKWSGSTVVLRLLYGSCSRYH